MTKIKRLIQSYSKFIEIPWRNDAAAAQRVIFCVYNENDELRLRAKIEEFEIATKNSGHEWAVYDLTDTFADWLAAQRYAQKYFQRPDLLSTLISKYLAFITEKFEEFLQANSINEDYVVVVA